MIFRNDQNRLTVAIAKTKSFKLCLYFQLDASECDKGQYYNDGCNYCMCIPSGGYACTKMTCSGDDGTASQPSVIQY